LLRFHNNLVDKNVTVSYLNQTKAELDRFAEGEIRQKKLMRNNTSVELAEAKKIQS
jgi:hypothetical protein